MHIGPMSLIGLCNRQVELSKFNTQPEEKRQSMPVALSAVDKDTGPRLPTQPTGDATLTFSCQWAAIPLKSVS